jgi:Fe-S oxidoreductase
MFKPELCIECGTCLSSCQYQDITRESAKEQIRTLKNGLPAAVLTGCITCMACNERCAEHARPYDLILACQEQQRVRMIPDEAIAVIEKTLAGQPTTVKQGDPDRPALCLCVMQQALPAGFLDSSLFAGMTTAQGGEFFSRIVYLHTAMESTVRRHARGVIDRLAALGHAEIVFAHADCYTLAACKAPEYGIQVPFRPIHLVEFLLAELRKQHSAIQPLGKAVAWQRPCIDRYTPHIDPLVDELFALIGVQRVERLYDRKNALCCGLGLRSTDPERQKLLQQRNLADCCANKAEALVMLCPGCYAALGGQCAAYGLKTIFLSDVCRMAIGEIPWQTRPLNPCYQKGS